MPNQMATMQGCCNCGQANCPVCACFAAIDGSTTLTLSVPTVHLATRGYDVCVESGGADRLAGLITMRGWPGCGTGAPSLCYGGTWLQECPLYGLTIIGTHYASNFGLPTTIWDGVDLVCVDCDCVIFTYRASAGWVIRYDRVTKRLHVFLAFIWYGAEGCPSTCGSHVFSYVRWEYTWEDCADLAHPTHVDTKMWTGWGENPTPEVDAGFVSSCDCAQSVTADIEHRLLGGGYVAVGEIAAGEWTPTVGDYMGSPCEVFDAGETAGYPAAKESNVYVEIKDLTPPIVTLPVCQDACCATEGGGPTAAITLVEEDGGCFIQATDASTAGTCGDIVRRLWVLESWDENPTSTPSESCPSRQSVKSSEELGLAETETFFGSLRGCGPKYWRLKLIVWDELDCYDVATTGIFGCCNCQDENGDLCANPPGTLVITPDPEDPCCYLLEAVGDATGYDGVCDDNAKIEWRLESGACDVSRSCSCAEIEAGDCGGPACSQGMAFGSSYNLCITEPTTLWWRARENECGCWGPWHEEPLDCQICECCDGPFASVTMTLAGVGQCPNTPAGVDCNCEAANGEYPFASRGCSSTSSKTDIIVCDIDGTPGASTVTLEYDLFCDETGYYLFLSFSTTGAAGTWGWNEYLFLGVDKPPCNTISGCVTFDFSTHGLVADACYCDFFTGLTVCAEFA